MSDERGVRIHGPGLGALESLVELWTALIESQRVYGANLDPTLNEAVARRYFGRLLVEDGVRVAMLDDRAIGFVSFELEPDQFQRDRSVGIVENLFVEQPYRHLGIGTALLRAAESTLAERGAELVQLEALASNVDAQSLYEDRGYQLKRLRYEKLVKTDNDNAPDEE